MNCKKCNTEFIPSKGLTYYCSLKCRNSRVRSDDVKDKISKGVRSSEKCISAWKSQKGVYKKLVTIENSKQLSSDRKYTCLHCGEVIFEKKYKNRKYHVECWKLCSGGYRENSTIKHASEYKGFKMQSGDELKFAKFCDLNKIHWTKNSKEYFEYTGLDGKTHKYYPDFYLYKYDIWIEIKAKYYADIDENVEIKKTLIKNYLYIDSKEIKKLELSTFLEKINKIKK